MKVKRKGSLVIKSVSMFQVNRNAVVTSFSVGTLAVKQMDESADGTASDGTNHIGPKVLGSLSGLNDLVWIVGDLCLEYHLGASNCRIETMSTKIDSVHFGDSKDDYEDRGSLDSMVVGHLS